MKKIDLLYQDEDLLVINKPANYLTIPDRYDQEKPNLLTDLRKRFGEVFTVHRLDKETSGVIVFARNEAAHRTVNQQFQNRTVRKLYQVLVEGNVAPVESAIEKAIGPHPTKKKQMVTNKGKSSLTHYKVTEQFRDYALVEANIKTGRTHQIRVHFESIGYPLMVDAIYGRSAEFYLSTIKSKRYKLGKDQEERPLMSRSSLHAYQLLLDQPSTKERLEFIAPLPKDFKAVLKQLQKWNK